MKLSPIFFCIAAGLLLLISIYPVEAILAGNEDRPEVMVTAPEAMEPEQDGLTVSDTDDGPVIDLNEMMDAGIGTLTLIDVDDPDDPLASLAKYYRQPIVPASMMPVSSSVWASTKDENDDFSNATEVFAGDEVTNNVTSWISGTTIHISDTDFYYIDLQCDGINNSVEKLEMTIFSDDAVDKEANLVTEALAGNILGQADQVNFEVTGAYHGNTSKIVIVPDGDTRVNVVMRYYFNFYSFNSTSIDYSFKMKVTTVTRTEWNGLFGGGYQLNRTRPAARMQSVNRTYDFYDWFDVSPYFEDIGVDEQRGDQVFISMKVDIATEERGSMYGYAGSVIHGVQVRTTPLIFMYFIYYNYTAQQLGIYAPGGNIPFASSMYGQDPNTDVKFRGQISNAWLGVSPYMTWIYGTSGYGGAEGNAHVVFNASVTSMDLIPPNNAPSISSNIKDLVFDEDTGPWDNSTDLLSHFSDLDTVTPLRFEVRNVGTLNPPQLKLTIDPDGRHLDIAVDTPNWYGKGTYYVVCYDDGVPSVSVDDREVSSNQFEVEVLALNDDAFIEKVDIQAGTPKVNDHTPIEITMMQGVALRSKKIYGRDNDTEDEKKLVYTAESPTNAFILYSTGQYDFVPGNDEVGTNLVRVTVDDGHSPYVDDYCLILFNVTNINDGPTLQSIEHRDTGKSFDLTEEDEPTFRNMKEDLEINLTVIASDPDIDIGQPERLTWSMGSPGWEAHQHPTDPSRAFITYTPTNDDSITGFAETTLEVLDGKNVASQMVRIVIQVENVNDKPRITEINGEVPSAGKIVLNQANGKMALEDQAFSLSVKATDPDPRESVLIRSNDPSFQVTLDPVDPFAANLTILPTQDMVGSQVILVTATDRDGETDTVRVEYEVKNTNDPPVKPVMKYDESVQLLTGVSITFWAEDAEDPDGDEMTFTWNFNDATPTVEGEQVSHTFTKPNTYTVDLVVRDIAGASVKVTRTITIYEPYIEPDPNLDSDGDGMIDTWEDDNGLDKYDANDSIEDRDNDDFSNYEEYLAGTNPLDPRDHPEVTDDGSGGLDPLIILLIVVVVVLLLLALVFFLFVVFRKPKPVAMQPMYGYEYPGMPPGAMAPQLQQAQTPQLQQAQTPQLPPAPAAAPPEDDLLYGFMQQASEDMRTEAKTDEQQNVWRPPEGAQPEQKSQVDDLFADGPDRSGGSPGPTKGPPSMPKLPDLPKAPPM